MVASKWLKENNLKKRKVEGFHLLIIIPTEFNFAERKSPWTKQYAGKPILITLLPLPELASFMSFLVIIPSETNFSPTRKHSLNKASNSYTIHEQYLFTIDRQSRKNRNIQGR